eukprot:2872921-Rhodomonas_salina.1
MGTSRGIRSVSFACINKTTVSRNASLASGHRSRLNSAANPPSSTWLSPSSQPATPLSSSSSSSSASSSTAQTPQTAANLRRQAWSPTMISKRSAWVLPRFLPYTAIHQPPCHAPLAPPRTVGLKLPSSSPPSTTMSSLTFISYGMCCADRVSVSPPPPWTA